MDGHQRRITRRTERSRRLGLATLAAGLILGSALAGSATGTDPAPRATTPSSVQINGWGGGGSSVSANGQVTAPRRACFDRRKVKLFAFVSDSDEPVFVGTDVTSRNGYWGVDGKAESLTGFRATIARKRIGRHRYCSKSVYETAPRMAPRATAPSELLPFVIAVGPESFEALGRVSSRKPCKDRRRVVLSVVGKSKVVAFDLASRNGFFGLAGEASAPDGWRLTAPAKRISEKLRCQRATRTFGGSGD